MAATLTGLLIDADAAAWADAGFTVRTSDPQHKPSEPVAGPGAGPDANAELDAREVCLGGVRIRLTPGDRGIAAWGFADLTTNPSPADPDTTNPGVAEPGTGDRRGPTSLDGLPLFGSPRSTTDESEVHPNGITGVDHVVIASPNLDRTIHALEAVGIEARRQRDVDMGGQPNRQVFFVVDTCIIELIGPVTPPEGDAGNRPASFWGLALTAADLDATIAHLGDAIGPPTTAVQPGRRIATIDRSASLGVRTAVLSARP